MIRSPRAILALLTLLNFINYLDRFLVSAVAPKIQESLSINDTQIGAITSAFMFGYFLTSPGFGWLGDRYKRKGLIAAGVAVWSLATAGSGLATSFGSMFAARVLVGIGEASYASLSPTIIDDIAPPENMLTMPRMVLAWSWKNCATFSGLMPGTGMKVPIR